MMMFLGQGVCITKTEKAESEAQRSKPKGTLESESLSPNTVSPPNTACRESKKRFDQSF